MYNQKILGLLFLNRPLLSRLLNSSLSWSFYFASSVDKTKSLFKFYFSTDATPQFLYKLTPLIDKKISLLLIRKELKWLNFRPDKRKIGQPSEIRSTYRERTVTVRTFLTHSFWQTGSFFPAIKRRFMRQGYGSYSNLSSWRFSVGSVPLNERRSREGNGKKVRTTTILFQVFRSWGRREEMWTGKTAMGRERGWELLSLIFISLFLSRSLTFAQHSTISTPGIGYSTNKPLAIHRLSKNKTKQT